MIIRIITGGFDPIRGDDVQRWGAEEFLPMVLGLPGFRGYHGGVDRDSSRMVAVSFWDSQEQADALAAHAGPLLGRLLALGVELDPPQTYDEALRA